GQVAAARGLLAVFTSYAWLSLPALGIGGFFVGGLLQHNLREVLPFITLLAALPLWWAAKGMYRQTPVVAWAYKAPWRVGAVLAMGVWVGQQNMAVSPAPKMAPVVMEEIGKAIKQQGQLLIGQPVAVMASQGVGPAAHYALSLKTPTLSIGAVPKTLKALHYMVRQGGAASLVVALPNEEMQTLLDLTPGILLATFLTTPEGLTLTGLALNPLYDDGNACQTNKTCEE
ncbi:MAG: hypothetical protein COY40_04440, partial [Alphaproteobacteria bacterium CG_4_10_14_0_8_um_filter_53_9]